MGKSSPPPVDYAAAAQQQGAANKETAIAQSMMNNPNMVTPYGTQTYTMGADGRPILTQSLSPAELQKLQSSQRIQQGSLDTLEGDMPNIQKALSGDFGLGGVAAVGVDPRNTQQAATTLGDIGQVQHSLDFSGAPSMPSNSPLAALQQQMAAYQKGAQYLDPQWKQTESDTTSRLANQGIVPGSDAYNREMDNQARQKQGAYSDLIQNSILSGNQENQAQFQRGLAARQEGVGEIGTQGQFANAAQGQDLQNAMSEYNARNQGVAQNNSLQQMIAQMNNSARSQNYNEYTTNRTMPINMLNALLSSSQVNNPQFQATTPTNIAAPPIMQGAQAQGQANAAQSSANSAQSGQTMQLAGTVLSVAAMF